MEKGKWRVEGESEGEGASKRPRVGPMAEQRWAEVKDPQVGS